MSPTTDADIKEFLDKFDRKLDVGLTQINQKLDAISKDVARIELNQVRLEGKVDGLQIRLEETEKRLDSKIDALDQRLDSKIDALDQRLDSKIEALGKRLDDKLDQMDKRLVNQEFINRGVLIGLLVSVVGSFLGIGALVAKSFGLFPNT